MSKPFVSLSFSTNKIQILKLNSSKTKVDNLTTVNIPKGLVTSYRVKDKTKLAGIIKLAFSNLRIGEKSVGIVVPEFSTFTKLIRLPKLEAKELDEAARWQAQEFLPDSSKDMVMDWKIVSTGLSGNQVMIAAIDKELLSGYVDAVGLAGLYPVLVETQSLSLLRIADGSDTGKIIVYKSTDEVIVTIAMGKSVLGSTVVGVSSDELVFQTIIQMVRHYKRIKVEKIIVAGLGFSQGFYSKVQQSLNVNIEGVKPRLTGLSNQQYQEYLIPISLQLEDPLEPKDETTINLLPPTWVKRYSNRRLKLQVWSMMTIGAVVVLGCFLAVLFVYMMLNNQLSDLKSRISQGNDNDLPANSVLAEVNEVNDLVNRVTSIDKISVEPQDVINKITTARPSGIKITNYSIDLDKGGIKLLGIAANRQVLIEFKNTLEEYEEFGSVSVPLQYLEAETDIEYEITFDYLPIKPQKKIKLKLN